MAREEMSESEFIWFWVKRVLLGATLVLAAGMGGCPVYNVWTARLDGEAVKARADGARQALVAQADAELASASKRAQAIEIMGEAAKRFPEYRQQEFIGAFAEAMKEGNIAQIIYVPTEANIPIMEAGRNAPPTEKK